MKTITPNMTCLQVERARAVVEAAAKDCGFSYNELVSVGRKRPVAEARFAAMLALYRCGWSFPQIAKATGRADHTTAIHGVERGIKLEREDPGFAFVVSRASAVAPPPGYKTWPRSQRQVS